MVECKFEPLSDDMFMELNHITKEPLTTLDTENIFNMDRDPMRHTKGGRICLLAIWHRTSHAALLRGADKEMLEVLSEDITESPRSAPLLCTSDSRECEFSFGEKFFDSSMKDSPLLPVYTPMNFWQCAYKNEAVVQCNENLFLFPQQCLALRDRV